jgi:hypothetical protein
MPLRCGFIELLGVDGGLGWTCFCVQKPIGRRVAKRRAHVSLRPKEPRGLRCRRTIHCDEGITMENYFGKHPCLRIIASQASHLFSRQPNLRRWDIHSANLHRLRAQILCCYGSLSCAPLSAIGIVVISILRPRHHLGSLGWTSLRCTLVGNGPSATSRDVRCLIAIGGKADEARTGQNRREDPLPT